MKKGYLHSEEQCFTVEGILFMGIEFVSINLTLAELWNGPLQY